MEGGEVGGSHLKGQARQCHEDAQVDAPAAAADDVRDRDHDDAWQM